MEKILIFSNLPYILQQKNEYSNVPYTLENIIGISEETKNLKSEILKFSKSNSTVLITGESGTGKELVASTIWKNSHRKNKPFVAINCAAIPEQLLESELFGYVKGAFTGASSQGKVGKFELANGGTIFLDEIGDIPLYLQVKLLRVLQEREVVRLGSNRVIDLDIRIIAATNKNLENLVIENKFREDLYYRLNVIPIHITPLRYRREDIEPLIFYEIEKYNKLSSKKFSFIEKETLDILKNYDFPGNVREIENIVEYMINMMGKDGILSKETLPLQILTSKNKKIDESRVMPLEILEKKEITKAIKLYGNSTESKKKIADSLGIGIATLYRKMNKYKLM